MSGLFRRLNKRKLNTIKRGYWKLKKLEFEYIWQDKKTKRYNECKLAKGTLSKANTMYRTLCLGDSQQISTDDDENQDTWKLSNQVNVFLLLLLFCFFFNFYFYFILLYNTNQVNVFLIIGFLK